MFRDSLSGMEILKKVFSRFFICIIGDYFERYERFFIMMCYLCQSGSFHIDELSTSCLECFSCFPRSDELIARDQDSRFEFWMFYREEIEERIET